MKDGMFQRWRESLKPDGLWSGGNGPKAVILVKKDSPSLSEKWLKKLRAIPEELPVELL